MRQAGTLFLPIPFNLFDCRRACMCGGKDRLRFVMPPDLEKYRPYVDGFDLSEAQKAELIHSVWAIMESFADRAFGLHPVQRVALSGSGRI
ncbi:MAG: hypothetical protein HWD60_19165 [Defluviicoccus sp.]|nr:MAG: hypothetical protein HWD60_19165 [Defluviicoccus sp.]